MMRKKITESYIVKYFSSSCSEMEKKEIDNWRNMSGSNQRVFEEFQALWGNTIPEMPDFDVEAGLGKVNMKLDERKGNVPDQHVEGTKKSISLRYMVSIAASVALVIGLYFGYKMIRSHNQLSYISLDTKAEEVVELGLADGSKVWINSISSLQYPKEFSGNERKVLLTGEAYFEVAKNPEKPFIIETGYSTIQVLGTAFNVRTIGSEGEEIVCVAEGLVSIASLEDKKVQSQVAAGEQSIYHKATGQIEKSAIRDINFNSWKTGKIVFSGTPMQEVGKTLTDYFKTPIIIIGDDLKEMPLTTTFTQPELEDVLKALELTGEIEILRTDDQIILKKKK